jgi:hypothetical protein
MWIKSRRVSKTTIMSVACKNFADALKKKKNQKKRKKEVWYIAQSIGQGL